jgi:hypothetical protein
MRFSVDDDDLDTAQLEQGSTATDYITHSYTLNEVFRDGAKNANDIYVISGRALTIEKTEKYYQWETLSNISSYMLNVDLPTNLNDKVYLRYDGKLSESGSMVHRFQYTSANQYFKTFTANLVEPFSYIATSPVNNNGLSFGFTGGTIGAYHELFNLVYLNLTALGLESLTQSQLDYLFTVWQFNNANAVVARQFIQTANIDTVAYGGLSYREIFEDGNLIVSPELQASWGGFGGTNFQVNNGILQFTGDGTTSNAGITQSGGNTIDTFYYRAKIKIDNNYARSGYGLSTNQYYQTTSNDFETFSLHRIAPPNNYFRFYIPYASTNTYFIDLNYGLYHINLTDLFGAGNEPDQATMDNLYQQYITLKGGLQ